MRIHNQNLAGAAGAETGRTQETQRSGQTGASESSRGAQSSDRVELSNTLGSLGRAISTDSAGRGNRVQALASLYQGGRYQVDSLATSRAMVADAFGAGTQPAG
jgi:anti-sigma28 factor (negative regulator of flagellin synthesis)